MKLCSDFSMTKPLVSRNVRTIVFSPAWLVGLFVVCLGCSPSAAPHLQGELIFPPQEKHVHASSIVECPNGDLLACWFWGSGERTASDVLIQGARLKKGSSTWSPIFLMADTPEIPDCNPVLFIDKQEQLWLFWIAVPADRWEDSLLRYRTATDYQGDGPLKWDWQDLIILKPGDEFLKATEDGFKTMPPPPGYGDNAAKEQNRVIEMAKDISLRQRGWMTRTPLVVLPSGRILLPLYSDGYLFGMMAISDDQGKTWRAGSPIVGLGLNQPTVLRKKDGTLLAYMRDEGPPPKRALLSVSKDDGETWSTAVDLDMLNPNSSLVGIVLDDGRWVMAYNDTEEGRHSLVLAMSDDEGETWKWERHLELQDEGAFHYPFMIQTRDGLIHLSYTHQPGEQADKSIKHVELNADWIIEGD
ncbi:MAG: sialidase family protein [bacterium]